MEDIMVEEAMAEMHFEGAQDKGDTKHANNVRNGAPQKPRVSTEDSDTPPEPEITDPQKDSSMENRGAIRTGELREYSHKTVHRNDARVDFTPTVYWSTIFDFSVQC
jgi:hypothetical protein